MDKSVEKLNELKTQEKIIKKLISNLEAQKQKLEVEELNLINLIDKEAKSENEAAVQSQSTVSQNWPDFTVDLNLDPFIKQNIQKEQIQEEEEEEE